MKINGLLFLGGMAFYLIVAIVYGVWTKIASPEGVIDWAGVVALTFTALLAFLVGFYLVFTNKRLGDGPEDILESMPEDADPDYGFFSPHSWWPLAVGGSVAIIAFGFVFAAWLVAMGVLFLMLALVGFVFEYYVGDHAH